MSALAAEQTIRDLTELFQGVHSPVIDVPVPVSGDDPKVVVVGDTHGQLQDVLHIFSVHGLPSDSVVYVFNGDIADRGPFACEIFLLLALFKLRRPGSVHLLRGNHENEQMNKRPFTQGGGFQEECLDKYGSAVREAFRHLFKVLPLFAVIGEEVFVVHGGLFRTPSASLARLRRLPQRAWQRSYPDPKKHEQWSEEEQIIFDAQWADPHDGLGCVPSKRGGPAMMFGSDVTCNFLDEAGLALCIRAHRAPETLRGYEFMHEGRLMTVFTASHYGGVVGNRGAVALLRPAAAGAAAPPQKSGPLPPGQDEFRDGAALSVAGAEGPFPPLRKTRLFVVEHDLYRGLLDLNERCFPALAASE